MQTLLVIGWVWPEPKSSAAGRYMLTLLQFFLAQNYQITFASAAAESQHRFPFESLGITKAEITLNHDSFDDFIQDLSPDVVLFDRYLMEEQYGWRVAKYCPNAIRILDLEDLQFLRHARHSALKQNRLATQVDYQSDIGLREVASIWRADIALVISEFELALLIEKFNLPKQKLLYIPFVLNNLPDTKKWQTYEQRQHFVTVGSFRHAPNWDAVLYLKQHIWPLIRQQLKQAELHIYGSYVPKKATQLHDPKQGFLIKGWVDDAESVVSNARVCLAPLRFGAGLKGKLFESMCAGTPSITTHIGAEGLQGNLDWCGVVAEEPQQFAQAAVQLYQDQKHWQVCQQQAFKLLSERYQAGPFFEQLKQTLLQLQNNTEAHRNQNFIGLMLQHHTMKSTQYMAQWIAEKNKTDE